VYPRGSVTREREYPTGRSRFSGPYSARLAHGCSWLPMVAEAASAGRSRVLEARVTIELTNPRKNGRSPR